MNRAQLREAARLLAITFLDPVLDAVDARLLALQQRCIRYLTTLRDAS